MKEFFKKFFDKYATFDNFMVGVLSLCTVALITLIFVGIGIGLSKINYSALSWRIPIIFLGICLMVFVSYIIIVLIGYKVDSFITKRLDYPDSREKEERTRKMIGELIKKYDIYVKAGDIDIHCDYIKTDFDILGDIKYVELRTTFPPTAIRHVNYEDIIWKEKKSGKEADIDVCGVLHIKDL